MNLSVIFYSELDFNLAVLFEFSTKIFLRRWLLRTRLVSERKSSAEGKNYPVLTGLYICVGLWVHLPLSSGTPFLITTFQYLYLVFKRQISKRVNIKKWSVKIKALRCLVCCSLGFKGFAMSIPNIKPFWFGRGAILGVKFDREKIDAAVCANDFNCLRKMIGSKLKIDFSSRADK